MVKRTGVVAAALVAGVVGLAQAQTQRFDDWEVGVTTDRGAMWAGTSNQSGSAFAQYCDTSGDCEYRLILDVRCSSSGQTPVLINSDAGQTGAMTGFLVCGGEHQTSRGRYWYSVGPFAEVDALVRAATRVGIAMPMQGDQFNVSRFSMRGATAALTVMRGIAKRAGSPQPGQNAIRDTRM